MPGRNIAIDPASATSVTSSALTQVLAIHSASMTPRKPISFHSAVRSGPSDSSSRRNAPTSPMVGRSGG